ncbi:hypothetical protein GWG54_17015 [Natronococcus sp. JC468]|uniref:hypothetical protein n=1 Tax=Natronococcus sp. JC468 TaxID=1961921 RepID=UPI001438A14A|nr:hypothetical protein [Natronococcus sp. JC468]NKE37477.1 hypothetical protein [Natronococcus sp. JC468]
MADEIDASAEVTSDELLKDAADSPEQSDETVGSTDHNQEAVKQSDQINRLIAVLRMKGVLSETGVHYIKTGEMDKEDFFDGLIYKDVEPFLLEMKEKGKYTEEDIDQWKSFLSPE